MATAADRIWDLRQTAPPAFAEVAPTRDRSRSPYSGGWNSHRDVPSWSPSNLRPGRVETTHPTHRKMTMEFVGTTTNSSTNLTNAVLPATGRKTLCPPNEANAASGGDCQNQKNNSNVLFTWLWIIIFWQLVIPRRLLSHFEHVLPGSSLAAPLGTKLIGANGASIPTWGFQKRTMA